MPRYHFGRHEYVLPKKPYRSPMRRENEKWQGPRVLTLLQSEQMGEAFVAWCAECRRERVTSVGAICIGCAIGGPAA